MAVHLCAGNDCDRLISVSISPMGSPTVRDAPDAWAQAPRECERCGARYCERCPREHPSQCACGAALPEGSSTGSLIDHERMRLLSSADSGDASAEQSAEYE